MKATISIIALLCGLSFAQEPSPLVFQPDPLTLGTMEQGSSKHIVLKGRNSGKATIAVESAMSQNVGSSNFKFPINIAPSSAFQIEFDLNTANMEGPFTHRIIIVEKGGKPHVTTIEGNVEAPILFSQQILDAGYMEPGKKPSWVLYAYNAKGTKFPLVLDPESAKNFQLEVSEVMLNTEKFDEIKEGGKTPGLKLKLTYNNPGNGPVNPKIRSIRQIVNMKSTSWPNATPSLFVVGYWK